MKTCVKLNMSNIKGIENAIQRNMIKTADAIKTDVQQSQTMPFRTGNLQNRSTFIDKTEVSNGAVYVVSDTVYARRLYFHPEYNFYNGENPNAGAKWFEPYISGNKKDYAQKVFAAFIQKSTGG